MATTSDFYTYITPWLQGITEPVLDQEIMRVARDIATRTHCEVVTQRIASLVGVDDYALVPGTGREPVRLMDVFYRAAKLGLVALPDISVPMALVGDIDTALAVQNSPQAAWGDNPLTKLYLYPLPSEAVANVITVRFSVKPTLTATTLPDVLLQYERVVSQGVIANCMAMPGQPFTNMQAYPGVKFSYEQALHSMRADIARGNAKSARRVNPVRFM